METHSQTYFKLCMHDISVGRLKQRPFRDETGTIRTPNKCCASYYHHLVYVQAQKTRNLQHAKSQGYTVVQSDVQAEGYARLSSTCMHSPCGTVEKIPEYEYGWFQSHIHPGTLQTQTVFVMSPGEYECCWLQSRVQGPCFVYNLDVLDIFTISPTNNLFSINFECNVQAHACIFQLSSLHAQREESIWGNCYQFCRIFAEPIEFVRYIL